MIFDGCFLDLYCARFMNAMMYSSMFLLIGWLGSRSFQRVSNASNQDVLSAKIM